jgi:hypothetical protein
VRRRREHKRSLAAIDIAREAPAAAEADARTLRYHARPDRQERARQGGLRVGAPKLVLRGLREHAKDPSVAGGDAGGPAARTAAARELGRERRVQAVARLNAAVPRGLQNAIEAGAAELRVRLVGDPAQPLGRGRALAQHRGKRRRLDDQCRFSRRPLAGRSGRIVAWARADGHPRRSSVKQGRAARLSKIGKPT